ncbi:MAG: maltose alpha-D-glucosyltransferase / alpha-amylase, partial [Candidatus Binatota bacterium]|nr:maltose alpha-D-glucosyltransferase / alpha-amylase [Candidatus Binatota bacterium]
HDPQARVNLGIRRRLAPLLGNDRKRIELMSGLLYSLPGTPVIYYGDEIGMGDNIYLGDRNGVRTPMQWNADRNAGFSRANPQRLYLPFIIDPEYHYESVNVENQQNNPHSLLWWTKRVISLRKRYKAFGRGSIDFLQPENRKVLAFVRRWQDQKLLVVANLSRFAQHVALDLSAFQGQTLLELFGKTRFPVIGDSPYALTLGAHTFYWFSIEPAPAQADAAARADLPRLSASGNWRNLLRGRAKATFEAVLPAYLGSRRWFLGKTRTILSVDVRELAAIPREEPAGVVALVRVAYRDGEPESYLLPLAFTPADRATAAIDAGVAVARLVVRTAAGEIEGVLHDALWDRAFANAVLAVAASAERLRADPGVIEASPTAPFRERLESISEFPEPSVVRADQSNTSVVYGDAFVLKLFRRLEDGPNPDAEIGRYLTEKSTFANAAPLASTLEFRRGRDMPSTLAVLHAYVPHQLDGWRHTMDALGRFFEDVLARTAEPTPSAPSAHVLDLVGQDIPPLAHELVGLYLEDARRLGRRTAELHLALAAADDPALAPEPFTDFYRRGQYQGMVSLLNRTMPLLRERLAELPEAERADAERVLASEAEIRKRFLPFRDHRISTIRIRCHGDYHLGQVLHTGKDFVIFDFEGEADRPLSVRRLKRSALRDVAGMLRSFQYAAYSALIGQIAGVRPEDFAPLAPWASWWQAWVSSAFLRSYLEGAGNAPFVPTSREEFHVMLDAFVLEKAIHELGYELANRARWVRVALVGLRQLIET